MATGRDTHRLHECRLSIGDQHKDVSVETVTVNPGVHVRRQVNARTEDNERSHSYNLTLYFVFKFHRFTQSLTTATVHPPIVRQQLHQLIKKVFRTCETFKFCGTFCRYFAKMIKTYSNIPKMTVVWERLIYELSCNNYKLL